MFYVAMVAVPVEDVPRPHRHHPTTAGQPPLEESLR